MKKIATVFILWTFCFSAFASNLPSRPKNGREYISHARVFKNWGDWQGQGEVSISDRTFRSGTRKAQFGVRRQITTHEKIGFHLGALTGHRHNTDWVANINNPQVFTWLETEGRVEGLAIFEALTKRWLGTTGLAWDFRLRWLYYEHNQFQSAQARAGLFWPRKGFSPGLQTEFSFPLNYGETGLDELWSYAYGVIDLTPQLKQVLKIGAGYYRWTGPETLGAATFHTIYPNIRIEIDFNYYFD